MLMCLVFLCECEQVVTIPWGPHYDFGIARNPLTRQCGRLLFSNFQTNKEKTFRMIFVFEY
jgi:hypothetical protein